MSKTIRLIPNPKTFADRENNKLYYRSKGFSKREMIITEKKEKFNEVFIKDLRKRSSDYGVLLAPVQYYDPPSTKKKKTEPHSHYDPQPEVSPTPLAQITNIWQYSIVANHSAPHSAEPPAAEPISIEVDDLPDSWDD